MAPARPMSRCPYASSRKLPREMSSRLIQFHNKGLEMDTLTALTDPVLTTVRRAVDEATKSVAEENKKQCVRFLPSLAPFGRTIRSWRAAGPKSWTGWLTFVLRDRKHGQWIENRSAIVRSLAQVFLSTCAVLPRRSQRNDPLIILCPFFCTDEPHNWLRSFSWTHPVSANAVTQPSPDFDCVLCASSGWNFGTRPEVQRASNWADLWHQSLD